MIAEADKEEQKELIDLFNQAEEAYRQKLQGLKESTPPAQE